MNFFVHFSFVVFAILFCCSIAVVLGSSNALVQKRSNVMPDELQSKINSLRMSGKNMLSSKNYSNAVKYYSAILQLVEGMDGEEAVEMRRRCGLTLAECEIKNGHLHNAVARCSEVIDELNNYFDEESNKIDESTKEYQQWVKAIAVAHCRRAVALKLLEKSDLASVDIKKSLKLNPKYTKSKLSKESMKVNSEHSKTSEKKLAEELLDFAEDCQCKHPRKSFTKEELSKLCKLSSTTLSKQGKVKSLASMGGFGAGDLFSGSSSPFGGFGGGLGGSGNTLDAINSMAPTIAALTGMDEKNIQRAIKVFKVVSKVFAGCKKVYEVISKNKEKLILALTLLWILSVTSNYYTPYLSQLMQFRKQL